MDYKSKIVWLKTPTEVLQSKDLLSSVRMMTTCLNQPELIDLDMLPELRLAFDFGYGTLPGTKQIRGDIKKYELLGGEPQQTPECWITPGLGGVGALISPALARNLYVNWKRNIKLS